MGECVCGCASMSLCACVRVYMRACERENVSVSGYHSQ